MSQAPLVDLGMWFVSTAALAGIIAPVVQFLKEHVFPRAEGMWVILLSLATGAILGFVGQHLGYVDGGVVGGLSFGVSAALLASGIWDISTNRIAARAEAQAKAERNMLMSINSTPAAPRAAPPTVAQFILDLAKGAVETAKLPSAISALAPLLAQFVQSEVVLTDDVRSSVQGQVLSILRKAGLSRVDL